MFLDISPGSFLFEYIPLQEYRILIVNCAFWLFCSYYELWLFSFPSIALCNSFPKCLQWPWHANPTKTPSAIFMLIKCVFEAMSTATTRETHQINQILLVNPYIEILYIFFLASRAGQKLFLVWPKGFYE